MEYDEMTERQLLAAIAESASEISAHLSTIASSLEEISASLEAVVVADGTAGHHTLRILDVGR